MQHAILYKLRWPALLLSYSLIFSPFSQAADTSKETPTELHQLIDRQAKAVEEKMISWRRDLHQHPELGEQETRTANKVAEHLRSLGLEVKTGVANTGIVALLKGGKPGPVVALRADMDALPVKERVNLPFTSKAKGMQQGQETDVMHACGHDAHMAILMATAEVLAGMKDQLPGSVKFIFQPAEEGPSTYNPDGKKSWGAKLMVEQGVMENPHVDAVFGLHVTNSMHSGNLGWNSGPILAASDLFWIDVQGKQTHGSQPWRGVDPIVTSAQIIQGLQTIVSRQSNLLKEPAVITVGMFHSGNRENIIPDTASLGGTIRTFDEKMRDDIHQRVINTATHIAQSNGATAEAKVVKIYDVTSNDPALTKQMSPTLQRVAGEGRAFPERNKVAGAEDFSFYLNKAPGIFFFLGVTPKETPIADSAGNHSPDFFVDERALLTGVKALTNLTVDYLMQAQASTAH